MVIGITIFGSSVLQIVHSKLATQHGGWSEGKQWRGCFPPDHLLHQESLVQQGVTQGGQLAQTAGDGTET